MRPRAASRRSRKHFLAVIAGGARLCLLLAVSLLAAALVSQNVKAQKDGSGGRWGEGYFPNLAVVNQHGKTLRFYDDVIKNKIVVVSFIYTGCTQICPLTTARMAQIADRLEDVLGTKIHFVSISVDPENDSPEKLAAYASAFYSGKGWQFLTGTLENIRAVNATLGERMRRLEDHRNEVVLGNDAIREWARNSVFGDLDRLAYDIRSMDPEWRAQVRPPLATSAEAMDQGAAPLVTGQNLFIKLCAGCHAFGAGDRVGPDLFDVHKRRPHEWLQRFIMSPERMRARKDPIATTLSQRYQAVRMPDLGLSANDAEDLIAFIESRSLTVERHTRHQQQLIGR